MTILVIEREGVHLAVARDLARAGDTIVERTPDAAALVAELRSLSPALIVIDGALPGARIIGGMLAARIDGDACGDVVSARLTDTGLHVVRASGEERTILPPATLITPQAREPYAHPRRSSTSVLDAREAVEKLRAIGAL